MRVIISKTDPDVTSEYIGQTIIIPDWLVKEKGITTHEIEIIKESEKALAIKLKNRTEWIPKSQIRIVERTEKRLVDFYEL